MSWTRVAQLAPSAMRSRIGAVVDGLNIRGGAAGGIRSGSTTVGMSANCVRAEGATRSREAATHCFWARAFVATTARISTIAGPLFIFFVAYRCECGGVSRIFTGGTRGKPELLCVLRASSHY